MEREIVLSSYLNNSSANNTPANFVTNFDRPVILDSNYEYMIGLYRIINMSFTCLNINPGYNNQKIKYSSDGCSTWKELTLPAGVYNYINMNAFLKNETVIKGDEDEYPITLGFQTSTFRVLIKLKTGCQLDLTGSNFHELIGFNKVILKDADNYGLRLPNLSQDTDILNIHCDLANTSLVDGVDTDVTYSFSTYILKPSFSFSIKPRRVTFNPMNKNTISRTGIYLTDGKRRQINNGADTAFSLLLKRILQSIYMKPYEFKRFYHPKMGKFV